MVGRTLRQAAAGRGTETLAEASASTEGEVVQGKSEGERGEG